MMDEAKCGILILFDFSPAFDTVVHALIIQHLKNISIVNEALEYITDYLNNRNYCMKIGDSFSSSEQIKRRVPQGRVLGLTLFCIYTAKIASIL